MVGEITVKIGKDSEGDFLGFCFIYGNIKETIFFFSFLFFNLLSSSDYRNWVIICFTRNVSLSYSYI